MALLPAAWQRPVQRSCSEGCVNTPLVADGLHGLLPDVAGLLPDVAATRQRFCMLSRDTQCPSAYFRRRVHAPRAKPNLAGVLGDLAADIAARGGGAHHHNALAPEGPRFPVVVAVYLPPRELVGACDKRPAIPALRTSWGMC